MIRPLRRCHRGLIGIVLVTLALAALLTISHPPPDVRIDALPSLLLPDSSAELAGRSTS